MLDHIIVATRVATLAFVLCPVACGGSAEAGAESPTLEERGRNVVAHAGCARCHQEADASAGLLSGRTTPRPGTRAFAANLTPDSETGLGRWSDVEIARAVRQGLDDEGKPLCVAMPRFNTMPDSDANAVVAYLRSVPPVRRVIPESECGVEE